MIRTWIILGFTVWGLTLRVVSGQVGFVNESEAFVSDANLSGSHLANSTTLQEGLASYFNPAAGATNQHKHTFSGSFRTHQFSVGYGGVLQTSVDTFKKITFGFVMVSTPTLIPVLDKPDLLNFTANDRHLLLGYSFKFSGYRRISAGSTLRIASRTVGDYAVGWGGSVDFGLNFIEAKYKLGLAVRNAPVGVLAWTYNETIFEQAFSRQFQTIVLNRREWVWPILLWGGEYTTLEKHWLKLQAYTTIITTSDNRTDLPIQLGIFGLNPRAGFGATWFKLFRVQGGIGFSKSGLTYGFGLNLNYEGWAIGYGYESLAPSVPAFGTHTFSCAVNFETLSRNR